MVYVLGYLSTCVVRRSRSGHKHLLVVLTVAHVLAACTTQSAAQPSSITVPQSKHLPEIANSPAEAAAGLILAERDATRSKDLDLLTELWTYDAQIIDGRGTEDPSDDYRWLGHAAIMDRYTVAVLPAPPPPLDPDALAALEIVAATDEAVIAELGVDRWRLIRQDGQWRLAELRYN